MELIVGDIAFSTWSLRAWMVLKRCGAEFRLRQIPLYGPGSREELAGVSPSGKVPLLRVDGETLWDSLAITLWCGERFPEARLWPADKAARWQALAVTCEKHSGFMALRTECSMGPDSQGFTHTMVGPERAPAPTGEETLSDIRRLVAIFREMRERFGAGHPYLFGDWSVPDAFFTPVATRFRHYGIDLAAHGDDGTAQAYCDTLLAQPEFLEWTALSGVLHDNFEGGI